MLSVICHLLLIFLGLFLFLGCFGVSFTQSLVTRYKKLILFLILLSVLLDGAIFYIWSLWVYLSHTVLVIVAYFLSLGFTHIKILGPTTLLAHSFVVEIEQSCSGLDSLLLFSVLYTAIVIIDWKKVNHKLIIGIFPLLLIGMFIINIIRVYALILIGILINPFFTLQLFHTYLGMVLFVTYFLLFLWIIYPHLLIKKQVDKISV